MLAVIVQRKYCYEVLKCIRAVMTMVCCFGCFNKSESGWFSCAEVCASATHFQRDVGTETCRTLTQVIIFRLRVAVRGQVAVMAGFYSAPNLHIISNLHSTGNVISYTVKMIQRGH